MNLVNEGVLPPDDPDDRDERREEQERARGRETVAEEAGKEQENRKTVADIVAEMRRGTTIKGYWSSCDLNEILQYLANRIDAAARRAYNEIDSAVCGIEDATSGEIGAVRKVMDETIGDHYE